MPRENRLTPVLTHWNRDGIRGHPSGVRGPLPVPDQSSAPDPETRNKEGHSSPLSGHSAFSSLLSPLSMEKTCLVMSPLPSLLPGHISLLRHATWSKSLPLPSPRCVIWKSGFSAHPCILTAIIQQPPNEVSCLWVSSSSSSLSSSCTYF